MAQSSQDMDLAESRRWLGDFRQALRFLRPQRRRIALAIACALGLAISLVGSLSAVQPILRIFVTEKDGPRAAVFKMAAERALDVELQSYDEDKHGGFAVAFPIDVAVVVKTIHDGSPVGLAGAHQGGVLFPADPAVDTRTGFLELLGASDQRLTLMTAAPADAEAMSIALARRTPGTFEGIMIGGLRFLGNLLPTSASPQATRRALMLVLSGVFAMVLFSNGCRFVSQYMIIIASSRAIMDMRRAMYRTIMYLPITWFGRHLSETMSRVVTDCRDVERGYRALFGKLMSEPIKVVALLIAAIITDWRITLFVMVSGPLGILIVSLLGRKIRKANRKLLAGYARMMAVLNAALSSMKVVRAYNSQTIERRRMWQAERRLLKQLLKIGRLEAMTGPLLEIMGVSVAMIGIVMLAETVLSGALPPERFFGLVVFMVFIFDALRKITAVYPRLAKADGAAQRVFEMINKSTESHLDHTMPALPVLKTAIEFEDVTYSYPEAQRPSLNEINLTIKQGQKVALVGPNGSGKTTCINLLDRFLDCDSGHIRFDGADISDFSVASVRDQISLVTQDAVVFALSAYENIAYGLPRAGMDQVVAAAKKAHAHEFIEQLPDGYQTVLGEFGATLSGGERQRLSLARAILRDAPIFIFDEATSQIDVDSERKIHKATSEFMHGRTSIVIAHRTRTIIDADQIAVFDRGRVIDVGTHDELLKRCELYRTLYHAHTDPQ